MSHPPIVVLWLKRDLRLHDHEPLARAIATGLPVLPVFLFEPELVQDPHYSTRHWRFIWESLLELREKLASFGGRLCVCFESADDFFKRLTASFTIHQVFSFEEVGIARTFERDLRMKDWFNHQGVHWDETPYAAVLRGLNHRRDWDEAWQKTMRSDLATPSLHSAKWASLGNFEPRRVPSNYAKKWSTPNPLMQKGGETEAWQVMQSFFDHRGQDYQRHISNPQLSQESCSRLSPYLAWGNLSIRQVYQLVIAHWRKPYWSRALRAFNSRLHWHCHFIQKFESECHMEFQPVNGGYRDFPYRDDEHVERDLKAWREGNTGYTMVDACMRSVNATGYLNFRMRAMLVSFLSHHLLIDWRRGVHHLAQQFLDFEPGIHYPQFQMQAGVTGTNTIRMYNPIKQAQDQDANGLFIRKWVPELAELPDEWLHDPRLITPMEQQMFGYDIPALYASPIVNIEDAAKRGRELLWSWRKKPEVKYEKARILVRHVRPKSQLS